MLVQDRLGAEILARSVPRPAGGIFQVALVLDSLECLFDPPATVVKVGKRGCWKGDGVEKRAHHDMHTFVRCHHANRGRRRWAFIALGIARIGRAQDGERYADITTCQGCSCGARQATES